jgi:phosphate transport system substrate-binding protein
MRLALATLALLAPVAPVIAQEKLAGTIAIDGSLTNYLTSEAAATCFKRLHPQVNFTVGVSGTGIGFAKLASGEVDIAAASRPICPMERDRCRQNGLELVELKVACEAIAVVIHHDNHWAKQLSLDHLRRIWHPDTAVRKWRDVEPAWPDQPITLVGTGCRGHCPTFDFFSLVIHGQEGQNIRADLFSQVDEVTLQGVRNEKYAMGFLSAAFCESHKSQVKAVAISTGEGAASWRPQAPLETATRPPVGVLPCRQTVLNGTYRPLSRPLYIYVSKKSLQRPEVAAFVRLQVERQDLVRDVRYIDLPRDQVDQELKKLAEALKR